MSMTSKVLSLLSVSYDESLLRTRHWILETAGFNVTSVGHSIPREDREALLKVLRKKAECHVLLLQKPGAPPLPGSDHSIDAWDGPETLISAVRKTLDGKAASTRDDTDNCGDGPARNSDFTALSTTTLIGV